MQKAIVVLAGLAALVGLFWPANDPAESLLRDYQSRLARTLEQDISIDRLTPATLLLPRETRLQALPEQRTSLGKALKLGECGLVPGLAKANNSLGKVAPASDQLLLTQELLAQAKTCETTDPALAEPLQQLILHREALWPRLLNNALIAGPEWDAYFASNAQALAPGTQIDFSLAALTDWLSEIDPYQPVDRADFNRRLQALSQSNQGAAAIHAHRLATHYFARLTPALKQTKICTGPRKVEQRRLAEQVFASQYLERVQPWLSDIDKALRQIEALQASLENKTGSLPQWLAVDSRFTKFQQMTREHAMAWKDLLGRCGIVLGS